MNKPLALLVFLVLTLAGAKGALAQAPQIDPSLKAMLGALPIAGMREDIKGMAATLRKTSCGGGLDGCYATSSGPLQLYFFTSGSAQQTLLLVVNRRMALPPLLNEKVQRLLGGTAVRDPMISISTTDYQLDTAQMPPALRQIVRDSYFNVNALAFSSGVQLAARADLGGVMQATLRSMGVQSDQLTLRAGVVMPIPADLAGAAGAGAGMADAMGHGATMKKAGADATKLEAYVEFQLAPGATVSMMTPSMTLTDATFFINNALTFGYKGNARFKGTSKDILLHFQTPLNAAGAMDLLDFSFRMAMPPTFTLEDQVYMSVAMAVPDTAMATAAAGSAALDKLGGGYIGNIKAFKGPLLTVTQPLSVFQLRNPRPAQPYRFGDRTKPFPSNDDPFNVILLGPLAEGGPFLYVASDVRILGQTMGRMEVSVGKSGFHGSAEETITVKLGPLGQTRIKMLARADISGTEQNVSLTGNLAGQRLALTMAGQTLTVTLSASCVNPFEINTSVTIRPDLDIAKILEGQGGANVDPSKLEGCVGRALEAALNKIAGEYKALDGYSAAAATAALKQIGDQAAAAAAAAEKAKRAAERAADKAYNHAKDKARNTANATASGAMSAFNDAGNAFKSLGKKKKHRKGPDPRFAASVFDWDYYYDEQPDLVKAGVDLATHWKDHGFKAGRRGSPEFHATYYRERYLDVRKQCASKDYDCVLQHWLDEGIEEGRQGSADVSVASYLARYTGLQRMFGKEAYADALEHWMNEGENQQRNARPEFDDNEPIYGPQMAGGDGGGAWTDIDTCHGKYVTGFRLRHSGGVDTVQFKYGSHGWAPPQGQAANGQFHTSVTLDADDSIVRVDYRSGARVDALTFRTAKGKKYGPYGGGGGSPGSYIASSGQKLACVAGRAGATIDRLVFSSTGPR